MKKYHLNYEILTNYRVKVMKTKATHLKIYLCSTCVGVYGWLLPVATLRSSYKS